MEPASADASDNAGTDSDSQRTGVRNSNASPDDDAPPPPPPPGPPREEPMLSHDTPQPTAPRASAWNEVLGGGADGASPPTRVREATPPRESSPGEPPAAPPAHPDDGDAAVARLMEEYEALKAERQALAARLAERQRAEAAESAKIEAELQALAAETVALNREMARREALGYADGPMPPEETRPRQFRRKPSVTSTPWR